MTEYKVSSDSWYKYKGVKPPERTPHGLTEEELDEKIHDVVKGHVCQWVQRGPDIICDVADFTHGQRIGTKKRLIESRNGEPIFKEL